jgi:hypothetical protein
MSRIFCFPLLLFPTLLFAQVRTHVGVNLGSLPLQALELRVDMEVAKHFALQIHTGFRSQNHDTDQPPRLGALATYVQPRNQSLFFSLGGRVFNRVGDYDYPYLALDAVGIYYNDKVQRYNHADRSVVTEETQGFRLGGTMTLGFVLRISERLHSDLALQMGYTKPREDVLAYYFPGMGYSTYGLGIIGVRGGHVQPVISLKYNIVQDRRQRIRRME